MAVFLGFSGTLRLKNVPAYAFAFQFFIPFMKIVKFTKARKKIIIRVSFPKEIKDRQRRLKNVFCLFFVICMKEAKTSSIVQRRKPL